MSEKKPSNQDIDVKIEGGVSGQVAVGRDIHQSQTVMSGAACLTESERTELKNLFAELRSKVVAEAPEELKDAAAERIQELEEAATDEKPDVSTMEYVRNWFVKRLPTLAGAVGSIVFSPIVGKLVEAAGDTIASEFRRRFGGGT